MYIYKEVKNRGVEEEVFVIVNDFLKYFYEFWYFRFFIKREIL